MNLIVNNPSLDAVGQLTVNPTVSAALYAANNSVGGKQTLSGICRSAGGAVILNDLTVIDRGNQKAQLSFLFYSQPITATGADKAAFVAATDIANCIGRIDVAAADYATFGSDSIAVAQERNLNLLLVNAETVQTRNIYVIALTTGTPTYTATDNLTWVLKFNQAF